MYKKILVSCCDALNLRQICSRKEHQFILALFFIYELTSFSWHKFVGIEQFDQIDCIQEPVSSYMLAEVHSIEVHSIEEQSIAAHSIEEHIGLCNLVVCMCSWETDCWQSLIQWRHPRQHQWQPQPNRLHCYCHSRTDGVHRPLQGGPL